MFELRLATPPEWIDGVLENFDSFLVDHAACERKASATGMSFVVRYPDRSEMLGPMIAFAREELEHFHQVYDIIEKRGLKLGGDRKDIYVRELRKLARMDSEEHLLDRLLIAGVVEARGCERFSIVANALEPGELKDFYGELTRSESRHHGLFLRLARIYFDAEVVRQRVDELLDEEAKIIERLPLRAALH